MLAMAAMEAAAQNWGHLEENQQGKQVMVKKAIKKKRKAKDIDAWFEEHGLANAMRKAISGKGIQPPLRHLLNLLHLQHHSVVGE